MTKLNTVMVLCSVGLAVSLVGACDEETDAEITARAAAAEIEPVARAPDGTVLWRARVGSEWVYFPSATTHQPTDPPVLTPEADFFQGAD